MENTQGKGGEGFIVADRVAAQAAAEKLYLLVHRALEGRVCGAHKYVCVSVFYV